MSAALAPAGGESGGLGGGAPQLPITSRPLVRLSGLPFSLQARLLSVGVCKGGQAGQALALAANQVAPLVYSLIPHVQPAPPSRLLQSAVAQISILGP